jgi:hypothetical protein
MAFLKFHRRRFRVKISENYRFAREHLVFSTYCSLMIQFCFLKLWRNRQASYIG